MTKQQKYPALNRLKRLLARIVLYPVLLIVFILILAPMHFVSYLFDMDEKVIQAKWQV